MNPSIFFQSFSTSITNKIVSAASLMVNRVLTQHPKTDWGFTDEELDFIINYDIKYRMGRDNGGED